MRRTRLRVGVHKLLSKDGDNSLCCLVSDYCFVYLDTDDVTGEVVYVGSTIDPDRREKDNGEWPGTTRRYLVEDTDKATNALGRLIEAAIIMLFRESICDGVTSRG